MAGPGGGPSRRSHTKSRKGCDICKRRHIRCDENFPQCKNCTKHKCRCSYKDIEDPVFSENDAAISNHQQLPVKTIFEPDNYRLLEHIKLVSTDLNRFHGNNFTIWTHQVPLFIKIGMDFDFVMHAMLALSATHLSWLTRCQLTAIQAYEHRGISIAGLQKAIGSFSRQNSDAVLAASLILSWQENCWDGWTKLARGTLSVIKVMQPWKDNSLFKDFIEEQLACPNFEFLRCPQSTMTNCN